MCVQKHDNAKCECNEGFHSVIHYKPTKKEFCTPGERERPDWAVIPNRINKLMPLHSPCRHGHADIGPAHPAGRHIWHCGAGRPHLHGAALVQQKQVPETPWPLCGHAPSTSDSLLERYRYEDVGPAAAALVLLSFSFTLPYT